MTEKAAVVKLNSDGEVVQCAKGAAPAECGYVEGAKVCGKCGAMAVSMKDDVPAVSVKQLKKKKMTGMMAVDADLDEELEMEEEVDNMDEEGMELVDDEEMDDDMDEDDEMESDEKMYGVDEEDDDMYVRRAAPKKKKKPGMNMMTDAEMMDDEDTPKGMNEGDEEEEEDCRAWVSSQKTLTTKHLCVPLTKKSTQVQQVFAIAALVAVLPKRECLH